MYLRSIIPAEDEIGYGRADCRHAAITSSLCNFVDNNWRYSGITYKIMIMLHLNIECSTRWSLIFRNLVNLPTPVVDTLRLKSRLRPRRYAIVSPASSLQERRRREWPNLERGCFCFCSFLIALPVLINSQLACRALTALVTSKSELNFAF